ncbi:CorA family divalent cation transporter [Candidatus Berkiella aquae]|uniref:Magnesium transport protein CorA n=1 Tax=Candidatus Berkiella aquae TaxID=295108 RepID=A0AAE3L7I7_9GAMM|nr:CorA family divalent cation transporter [Candidatus Berkiella aquae]MCS5711331.1 hypothetical protein [Candidatus Berkiella aquae]
MITYLYIDQNGVLVKNPANATLAWIDVNSPTLEERTAIEKQMNIILPQHHELHQLEYSNRFYMENDSLFMFVNVLTKAAPLPETHAITLIVTPKGLVTLRYSHPNPIQLLLDQIDQRPIEAKNYLSILPMLLEIFVGKIADVFELVGETSDQMVMTLIRSVNNKMKKNHNEALNKLLREINSLENLLSKGYQSLSSINLLLGFYEQHDNEHKENYYIVNMEIIKKDLKSLLKHGDYLTQKLSFHLQSTLGLINIEQTQIVKMFTVLAMVFLPPTLLASIYGMNFKFMPELDWVYGYPLAVILMIGSAFIPYRYFKKKGWI